jgi:hypothetical protein
MQTSHKRQHVVGTSSSPDVMMHVLSFLDNVQPLHAVSRAWRKDTVLFESQRKSLVMDILSPQHMRLLEDSNHWHVLERWSKSLERLSLTDGDGSRSREFNLSSSATTLLARMIHAARRLQHFSFLLPHYSWSGFSGSYCRQVPHMLQNWSLPTCPLRTFVWHSDLTLPQGWLALHWASLQTLELHYQEIEELLPLSEPAPNLHSLTLLHSLAWNWKIYDLVQHNRMPALRSLVVTCFRHHHKLSSSCTESIRSYWAQHPRLKTLSVANDEHKEGFRLERNQSMHIWSQTTAIEQNAFECIPPNCTVDELQIVVQNLCDDSIQFVRTASAFGRVRCLGLLDLYVGHVIPKKPSYLDHDDPFDDLAAVKMLVHAMDLSQVRTLVIRSAWYNRPDILDLWEQAAPKLQSMQFVLTGVVAMPSEFLTRRLTSKRFTIQYHVTSN